jgi:DNA polymerase zeta
MMNQLSALLFAYVLGGLTFLPLLVIAVVIHAYFTFPVRSADSTDLQKDDLLRAGDDADIIKAASKELEEKFRVPKGHDPDGIAGYFAVCREFVPGGINGKPPERITPTGATSITSPSPSVYQSMYRSIFERKKDGNNPLEHKNGAKPPSKSGNVFYVVLRYRTLRSVLELYFDDTNFFVGINIFCYLTPKSNWKCVTSSLWYITTSAYMVAAKKSPKANYSSREMPFVCHGRMNHQGQFRME